MHLMFIKPVDIDPAFGVIFHDIPPRRPFDIERRHEISDMDYTEAHTNITGGDMGAVKAHERLEM
ncbi:hypothetical protein D3C84_1063650 [compost metagenome]